MAKITLELIKELREKTQVGMMDCKQALVLAEGDIEKAIEILRKKGASVAAKRAEHATNNGIVTTFISYHPVNITCFAIVVNTKYIS